MSVVIFDQMLGKVFDSVKVYSDDLPEQLWSHLRETWYHTPYETLVFSSKDLIVSFFHRQDCCESVSIKEIVGDLSDLEGSPILEAEETVEFNSNRSLYEYESETYSFYKFRTKKGFVTVTWIGQSNGHYSESVDVDFFNP